MPNVLSALLPHSPLLIPEIGKNHQKIFQETLAAYELISEKIRQSKTEIIIIISSHGPAPEKNFSLGIASSFKVSFDQFSCLLDRQKIKSALLLSELLKEKMANHFPCFLFPQKTLDYGSAIPLELLKIGEKNIKALPIIPAKNLDYPSYYEFGVLLREFLASRPEKIALIASGDLSHRLKRNSPGGYSPKGVKFDNKIQEYLNEPKKVKEKMLNFKPETIEEVQECLLKPLLILLGAVGDNYQPEKLAYQNNFGVGYLSFLFNFNNN